MKKEKEKNKKNKNGEIDYFTKKKSKWRRQWWDEKTLREGARRGKGRRGGGGEVRDRKRGKN